MGILNRLLEAIRDPDYRCPNCEYEPTIAVDGFRMAGGGSGALDAYECPECSERFEAILCRCGNGYESLSKFDEVRERADGVTEYVCGCGRTLHREY